MRSFWRCDEAAYCTYAAAPWPGIDRRQLVGSYRGGLFWLSWDADLAGQADWYGGPPTEVQWEYGRRASTSTPFNTGRTLPRGVAIYYWPYGYPSNRAGVSPPGSVAVGSFPPNAWGLYDMHGNVWQ